MLDTRNRYWFWICIR